MIRMFCGKKVEVINRYDTYAGDYRKSEIIAVVKDEDGVVLEVPFLDLEKVEEALA
jgi:hypothetical protein